MKKLLIASLVTLSALANAADYASVDVDHVVSKQGYASSQAQYVRLGKEVAGLQLGVQSRTAVVSTGGMYNSLETTVGKNVAGFTPFVGMGFDNGLNGAKGADYRYTLAGVTTGAGISVKLQSSFGGNTNADWKDANSASITGNGWVYIRMNVQNSTDQALLPLADVGRLYLTTGAGSSLTVDAAYVLQGL